MGIMQDVQGIISKTSDLVVAQLDRVNDIADDQLNSLTDEVKSITDVWLQLSEPSWPAEPLSPAPLALEDLNPGNPVSVADFGDLHIGNLPTMPHLDTTVEQSEEEFPEFDSDIQMNEVDKPTLNLPVLTAEMPELQDIELPEPPVLVFPPAPELAPITIPTFVFPPIPPFTVTVPEFVETPLTYIFEYEEPVYESEILDEVMEEVRALMNGELGLPPEVELAMWERAVSREDIAIARQVADAAIEYASRGFTAPPGMLAARIDAVRDEGTIKKLALNREITIEVAKIRVENVKFGIQQGIACEQLLMNLFNNQAQRAFEIARASLQLQIDVYNARVSMYNGRVAAYGIQAQVYKIQLDAQLAQIEVYKAQIAGEVAKGQLNEQLVQVYTAQLDALSKQVEIYTAEMNGAKVAAEVDKTRIEGYKAQVDAYAAELSANKFHIDMYEAEVRAETSKAAFINAEVSAYQAVIQGKSAQVEQNVKNAELLVQSNRATIEGFRAQLEATTSQTTLGLQSIEAHSKAYIADVQRWAAEAGANSDKAKVEIAAYDAASQSNVASIDAATKRYSAQVDYLLRRAQMTSESAMSASRIVSTIAAGAMSAVNLGASMQASGSAGEGYSITNTQTANETYSYNVSSKGEDGGSALQSGSLAQKPW